MDQPQKQIPKKTNGWLLTLIILLVIIIGLSLYLFGYYLPKKTQKSIFQTPTPSPQVTSPSPQTSLTPTSQLRTPPAGWQVYKNEDYGWQVFYPDGANIGSAGEPTDPASNTLSKEVCKTFETNYLYVNISSKENKDGMYICTRTGVGEGYIENTPDDIMIMGKSYQAKGMKFSSASLNTIDAFWNLNLSDGTVIEYGVKINPVKTGEMTEDEAHNQVKAMVQSFKYL